ncbi:1-phosphatidylinositol 4,5-bisphosphate phosphodiesterase zeta-1-like isoform X2 [Betta splendens]|uniref:Phosphoinositide phospholipase C n=1 Tax=Betta splendens TaxID=158456 RepID=A0A6P7MPJ2_BETSP|nr:1-phosphatidylinositol 4,5-bisphosphate phosphodiesterase zeta-1-like isoform X2 [Betta splendens]
MMKSWSPASRREDLQKLFQGYASGRPALPARALLRFLHQEQMELEATEETAERLIGTYEVEEAARGSGSMTFDGFLRYMESREGCVFNRAHACVYQDMEQPLSSYFISSSHNTYLTGDQLVGESHLDAYVYALRKGCRCLEIDCWDGPDMEPVVYHGYTLTTKIRFRDVVATVEQHAFQTSAYPVILSLENHCSEEQQEVMAQHLISILGNKLLSAPLPQAAAGGLPSPNDLKYKVLIKNKKLKPQIRAEEAAGTEAEESVNEGEDEDEEEDDDADHDKTTAKCCLLKKSESKKRRKVQVAPVLSDLVIYTSSVKFVSFSHAKQHQSHCENSSVAEKKARRLLRASGADFVQHNQRFLSRIYPAGSRTSSSNYNPQEFWNVGAQLVALNFQSLGLPMDLNHGRFQDNGGCGYVLKPPVLRSSRSFDPGCSKHSHKPTNLLLKVISASNLPVPRGGKALDPLVRVEIHGTASDSQRRSTHAVKSNSLSPHWDVNMDFSLRVPELSLVRFCVRDQTGLFSSDFVGQYTLPFSSLKKGYRWVPLLSRDGCSLDPASLFVFVWHS